MNVKSTFLNGSPNEKVYIHQPDGYIKHGQEHKVCLLKKALYGLKQAPRASYYRIDAYFQKHGINQCTFAHTLFLKFNNDTRVLVCLSVDDLIIASNSLKESVLSKMI